MRTKTIDVITASESAVVAYSRIINEIGIQPGNASVYASADEGSNPPTWTLKVHAHTKKDREQAYYHVRGVLNAIWHEYALNSSLGDDKSLISRVKTIQQNYQEGHK